MRTVTETVDHYAFTTGDDDTHGNPSESFADPVSVDIWRFAPGGTSEPLLPGQQRVITQPTIYLPTADIGPHDEIEVRGTRYEVVGDPADWRNGDFAGLVIELRRVEG